jgi:RND superfamily putative drug exporter
MNPLSHNTMGKDKHVRTQPVTVRVARWSATHPWRAIGLWVVFVAVCFAAGGWAGTNEATDEDLAVGEAGRATTIVDAGHFDEHAKENLLITAREGRLDQAEAQAAAADAAKRLGALKEVQEVGDPVPSQDGNALLVPVTMSGAEDEATKHVDTLLDQTAAVQKAHPGIRVEQVGDESIGKGINDQVANDLSKAEFISLPVTLVIMLIAFGAIIAAGVPVLLAISAVGAAFGLSALASHLVPSVDSIGSVILLMGMAVGVDYSLFYLKREREERQNGASHTRAVEIAAATSGHSVVVSGVAVIVSMAGLYLANDAVFASLATGSVIVVAVAVLGSLTVLPALLAKLGKRVDRPRVPPRVWPKLLRPALRYPVVTLVLSAAALGALALPAIDMKLKSTGVADLPRSIPVVQSYDRLTEAFPSEGTTHVVAVRAEPRQAARVRAELTELSNRDRFRAAADIPDHGGDVPVPGRRAHRAAAELTVLRGRVRHPRARVPAQLGGGHPGLPFERHARRVDPALPVRGPVRTVHGLPRVRGPRGCAGWDVHQGRRRVRHQPLSRSGDLGGRPRGRRVHQRDDHSGARAAVLMALLGKAKLVAGTNPA